MAIERLRFGNQPERLPPHNAEAEEAILGSVLLDREVIARVMAIVEPRDFYRDRNAIIYGAMCDLVEAESKIDYLTLIDELDRTGRLDGAGGTTYVAGLLGAVPTPIHAEYYARIVADCGFMRRLVSAGGKIATIGFENRFDTVAALEKCEQLLADVTGGGAARDVRSQEAVMQELQDRLAEAESVAGRATPGTLPTTFARLDGLLGGGFQRGDLVLLAGRPGIGKSSLMVSLLTAMLLAFKGRAVVFSLEMTAEALVTRQLSGASGVPLQNFRDGRYPDGYIRPLGKALGDLANLDIWYDDGATQTVGSIKAKARRLAANGELDMVIVDHIQLLDGQIAHGESRQQQMAAITRGLKALAKELGVVVLALSQLNRSVEQRSEKRPQLSDLRESGTLEQDADSVLMLWRNGEGREFLADLRVAKARNGRSGDVVLTWNPDTTTFGPFDDPRA